MKKIGIIILILFSISSILSIFTTIYLGRNFEDFDEGEEEEEEEEEEYKDDRIGKNYEFEKKLDYLGSDLQDYNDKKKKKVNY